MKQPILRVTESEYTGIILSLFDVQWTIKIKL